MSDQPRKTPPAKRALAVIFARAPGEVPRALVKRLEDGQARHAGRRAGTNWAPVRDLIVTADPAVLTRPIKRKRVVAVLAALVPQTREVKRAQQDYLTFIKWHRMHPKNM